MEDRCSVNSPRRILSVSKRRRASDEKAPGFGLSGDHGRRRASDEKAPGFGLSGDHGRRRASDEKAPGFGLSGDHGPKPSEVYGFVGSISTVVATVIYLIWAYLPDSCLHSIGIYYYPSRYWAVAVPIYVMVSIALALVFYIGLNFLSTPSPTSFHNIFDEFSKEPFTPACSEQDRPIEPISDIGINRINKLMFNNKK